jgi:bud emergence protein 1
LSAVRHLALVFRKGSTCIKLTIYLIRQVIKALFDYRADDSNPLSFSQGDFSHVGTGKNDLDWFQACKPLNCPRGLVPVSYFEDVAKKERDGAGSDPYQHAKTQRYAYDYIAPLRAVGNSNTHITEGFVQSVASQHMHVAQSEKRSAKIYGIVMYNFKAERQDELDAKEGDTIVVIAQSNPEWLLAKPITRLGGPGLIPLSFIEIRDVATGQAVPNAQRAVSAAGVPKVEEWKEMVAAYESCRVPLDRLEHNSLPSLQAGYECMNLVGGNQTQGGSGLVSYYGQEDLCRSNNVTVVPLTAWFCC